MKDIIYIIAFLFFIHSNGQNKSLKDKFRVDLLIIEKTTKDTLVSSIIEVFSGGKRIETNISDFDGISVFGINSKEVVNNKILLRVHGVKCSVFEKEYELIEDMHTRVYLEYGNSDYSHRNQLSKMYKILNIEPKVYEECGFEEPIIVIEN